LQLGVLRVRRQNVWLAHQHQRGFGMASQKGQAGRHGNGRTDVPAHGVDSDPDHEKTGAVKIDLWTKERPAG